jgi:hypothetical protein
MQRLPSWVPGWAQAVYGQMTCGNLAASNSDEGGGGQRLVDRLNLARLRVRVVLPRSTQLGKSNLQEMERSAVLSFLKAILDIS